MLFFLHSLAKNTRTISQVKIIEIKNRSTDNGAAIFRLISKFQNEQIPQI